MRICLSCMHLGGISNDGVQPGTKFGAALKLSQMQKRGEKALLQNVLGILHVTRQPAGSSRQLRYARSEESFQLAGVHVHWQHVR